MNGLYAVLPVFAQNLAASGAGFLRARTRFSPFFYETLERWEQTVHGPLEALHALQRERLDALVERAREFAPYYRDLPPPSDHPDPAEAMRRTLAQIPPLEKQQYREHHQEFLAQDVPRSRLIRSFTSGTTGTALPVYHTPERIAEGYAAVWRQRRAFGVDMNDPQMTFAGQLIVPFRQKKPPFWRTNWYGKQTLFSVYHLSPRNLPSYVDAIHATPARYVQGYPSALHIVSRAVLDAGKPVEPGLIQAVFTSSESLLAYQREAIEAAFSAPVRDHYAATELDVSMTACEHNGLHVDMEFCIVEVEPLEETDEYVRGHLLVTGIGTDAMVLFRYRIGDVGTLSKRPCPCGRPGDVYLEIDGRVEDYVLTPDGRRVGRLDHIFKDQVDVGEAQIIQETKDAVTVMIVPRPSYSDASQKKLLHAMRERLGDEIQIDIRITDAIPREANGKFRAVKSFVGKEAA